jgi:glycosyltransferase involved in cell wall biosynthesis
MLSILIPIYNYDIRALVEELIQQAQKIDGGYEIVCIDDKSDPSYQQLNQEIQGLDQVRYEELSENIGRSAIRNLLAEKAKYEFLLFMDCDTMPEKNDFLAAYYWNLEKGKLLYGGRSYSLRPPEEKEYFFHWFYGSNREVKAAKDRKLSPYQSFMTNNFVIPKSILLNIRFDERLKQYGHEDTLFGLELKARKIPILHLDNPMRHIGLDEAESFLRKSEQAIENLLLLKKSYDLRAEIKLLRYFEKTKKWGLHPLIRLWFKLNKKRLRLNLLGTRPKLRAFDLYKLGYMVSIKNSK